MKKLIAKYLRKLYSQKLVDKDDAVFIALDADLFSNKALKNEALELSRIFEVMNINSLLFAEPAEPYRSIISELTANGHLNQILTKYYENVQSVSLNSSEGGLLNKIIPMDCETRTFFHDIPVVEDFTYAVIAGALSRRKSAIIKDKGIITYGTVTPEQAYVSYSSVCFSAFVKYFFDALLYFEYCSVNKIPPDDNFLNSFKRVARYAENDSLNRFDIKNPAAKSIDNLKTFCKKGYSFSPVIAKKPEDEYEVLRSLEETGKAVVGLRLVDSYFGNISYVFQENIFISQTGSSLDELEGCIDKVPLDGSSSVGITSSSELSTHRRIYFNTGHNAILHAHPRFSVIMSMNCPLNDCPHFTTRRMCHEDCKQKRYISGIPIVSGEVGTGRTGIVNTVPLAIKEAGGVIIYGHGVFTSGTDDFSIPLSLLLDIERMCQDEYFKRIYGYITRHLY